MNSKILSLFLVVIILLTHSGCATLNKSGMQTDTAYSTDTLSDRQAQWKKEEREWLLAVLIAVGVAIAVGATVSASSGGSGFFIGAHN